MSDVTIFDTNIFLYEIIKVVYDISISVLVFIDETASFYEPV